MNMHAGILGDICVIWVNLVGVNRKTRVLMLFASHAGCEAAEVGSSGGVTGERGDTWQR